MLPRKWRSNKHRLRHVSWDFKEHFCLKSGVTKWRGTSFCSVCSLLWPPWCPAQSSFVERKVLKGEVGGKPWSNPLPPQVYPDQPVLCIQGWDSHSSLQASVCSSLPPKGDLDLHKSKETRGHFPITHSGPEQPQIILDTDVLCVSVCWCLTVYVCTGVCAGVCMHWCMCWCLC